MSVNSNLLGLVFANMHDASVLELTKQRTMGSILYGGRYRLIDFPLSNMCNSGVSEVGVITKSNYQSLLDHLGSGREWDLARKKGGLHLLPPFGNVNSGMYRGRLEALYGIYSFIDRADADYVVLSDCDIVTNISFKPIVKKHIETGADITVIYSSTNASMEQCKHATIVSLDDDNNVVDVLINPLMSGSCCMSLNMFVVTKKFLLDMVAEAYSKSKYSFERDILQARCSEYNIKGYKHDGYFQKIDSIQSYYTGNMELLNTENCDKLFNTDSPIYTKIRDNAPAKYGIDSTVSNSLIADGCIIEGTVENSVLFRGVKIEKGACIKNSILMQDTKIGQKCQISCVITDKAVEISNFKMLTGSANYPLFIGKNAII